MTKSRKTADLVNALIVDNSNNVGIGTSTPTAKLHVSGSDGANLFRLETKFTPTGTADASGQVGNIAWDDSYVYVKTAAGWKRSALGTF
jgi:hypothetical protein